MGQALSCLSAPDAPRIRLPNATPAFLAGAREAIGRYGAVEADDGSLVVEPTGNDHAAGYMAVVMALVKFQPLTSI